MVKSHETYDHSQHEEDTRVLNLVQFVLAVVGVERN